MTRPFRFSIQASVPRPAAEWRELGRRAEDLGYSALSVSDHLDTEMAPLIALAVTAEATRNLRLTTLVLSNDFRHPAFLAKQAATLDLLSDGRLELGVGAGWKTSDYEQSGIPLDRPGIRIERLTEAITVLKGCFADGPFDFDGEHYTIRGLDGQPACVQRPHPPILLAGGGRRMLTLAAHQADIVGLNASLHAGVIDHNAGPSATTDATDQKMEWIREAAGDRFNQIELQTRVHVSSITDDHEGIADLMAPALGISPEEALASPHVLVGSEGQCVETLLAWRERWGLTYIGLNEDSMVEFGPVVEALTGV
ncbi:MAG: TIGR03621 family F420-dependent LLM class oxidoreductase [Actinobacteria bacterium]|jgi:probable F420-dependent oxidoreductase|nr:TIGR03621 family F420-dependent LLM class oxidoreductase [Actinomycetota bacterium]MBT3688274.1 TIGR03621 family F420-dependent LLM class oxidoreductase [Actinomycetota bacterium]MBT4037172.1 TIGR03621 family F420-dependent LLM class oxidoreductase [Actinomycetota bacterium]MBT6212260.1 TIGR03621 family F420-dependent LLM class oxidoreductase [Actinomycetota bacterium]MBT6281730.1 TIGR03621 family F420-dependent LLM class oxidoreductase [Actinomycetota bacterium]